MKKILVTTILFSAILAGCSDFLDEKNETQLSTSFIYDTPEGIGFAVTALYPMARNLNTASRGPSGALGNEFIMTCTALPGGDDLTFFRAGSYGWAGCSLYDNLRPDDESVLGFWSHNYEMIGKANEIIYYGLKLDQTNPLVKQALGEAYCFRAKAYMDLYRRFDNIFWHDEVINADNVDKEREYAPDDEEYVVGKIKEDLDNAIARLGWTTAELGRFTQGAARHMKLMIDMWPVNGDPDNMDLDDAIIQVEELEQHYSLLAEPGDVFTPASPVSLVSAKLNSSETILVEQWSNEPGGYTLNNNGGRWSHRFTAYHHPMYDQLPGGGAAQKLDQGGRGWGRVYPNEYLLSLYDQAKDKRYTQFYQHFWKFNNIGEGKTLQRKIQITQDVLDLYNSGFPLGFDIPDDTPVGSYLEFTFRDGDIIPRVMTNNYAQQLNPATLKYYDVWTRAGNVLDAYKDIVIFRVAESFILGAEAYLRKGNQERARYFFNKTWERAGNDAWTANLTLQNILDEDARELGLEGIGHRWYTLKRFGADVMYRQITNYAGSKNDIHKLSWATATGNITKPEGSAQNYALYFSTRSNFAGSKITVGGKETIIYMRWPIPISQIQSMGGNYPQNPGYN